MYAHMSYLVLAVCFCLVGVCFAQTTYFLVAEPNTPIYGDSYILPLTEPNDIAHARDLIKYGHSIGKPIVVADIACGSDCINRDYFKSNKYPWWWHVTDFNSFADTTEESLDGWPGLVDDNCGWWVGYTGGRIGFWSYTVVAELGEDPCHWNRDFDDDDDIDFFDYSPLADIWDANCVPDDWCGDMDLDQSGKVDSKDLQIFAESWLTPYASDPVTPPVYAECWNWPYQCYGDADGLTEGLFKYRVYVNDASILVSCWKMKDTDQGFNGCACADFNRDGEIDEDDQMILTENLRKKDSDFAITCKPSVIICPP